MKRTEMGKSDAEGVLDMPNNLPEGSGDTNDEQEAPPAFTVRPESLKKKLAEDKELAAKLEARSHKSKGNPNAKVADPHLPNIVPRYDIVQNRTDKILIVPDLKTNVEDMGLVFQPGEVVILTDYYTPQEINRSKGLRFAATKLPGFVEGEFGLVPLTSEEEGHKFKMPEKVKLAKGTSIEDTAPNDFDLRFEELEQREAKREEKLLRKTLGIRRTKQHGAAPAHV